MSPTMPHNFVAPFLARPAAIAATLTVALGGALLLLTSAGQRQVHTRPDACASEIARVVRASSEFRAVSGHDTAVPAELREPLRQARWMCQHSGPDAREAMARIADAIERRTEEAYASRTERR